MTDCVIDVSSLTTGAQTANSINPSCFNNAADTVSANTFWTPLSAKYLEATSIANFVVDSTPEGNMRDVELTTWTRDGRVFLRLAGGNAIYFWHNGETVSGSLEIGIATGVDQSSYPSGTSYPLYKNADLVGTISGYNRTDTTGASFTFGVSGFDIYAKFNGTEFCRFKDYRQMSAGIVALKANTGHGFRSITLHPLATASLSSNYASNELDLSDWNVRALQTTGSIVSGQNTLTVASAAGFKVGDWVIVEIGAESGAGARGTMGVGGTWPTLSYANAAAMNADTSQVDFTYAFKRDDGVVYQWTGAGVATAWDSGTIYSFGTRVSFSGTNYQSILNGPNIGNPPNTSPTAWQSIGSNAWVANVGYYVAKAIPLSLHGKISSIVGNVLTLLKADGVTNANASASVTSANVYLNNQPYINYLTMAQKSGNFYGDLTAITPANMTIIFQSGSFAGGGTIRIAARDGWILKGQGQSITTLFSPKGAYPLNIYVDQISGVTVKDFTLQGNFGLEKYGLAFPGWTYVPGGMNTSGPWAGMPANTDDGTGGLISQTNIPQGSAYPPGIFFNIAPNGIAQDITANDISQKVIGTNFAHNVFAYRITNNETSVLQVYVQWQFQWANSNGGGCVDCVINSVAMRQGFESFVCDGHQFVRCIGNNASFSQNDSQNWLIKDSTITLTPSNQALPPAWSKFNPLVNINANIGAGSTTAGGLIKNIAMNILGYIDADNDLPYGININDANPNVTICDGHYDSPDWSANTDPLLAGPVGVRSTGAGTEVIRFRCGGSIGNPDGTIHRANIGVNAGNVYRCFANLIVVGTGTTVSATDPGVTGLRMKH